MLEASHSPPPPLPSNRKFGWLIAAVLAVLAVHALWKGYETRAAIFAVLAAFFAVAALAAPKLLTPLNRLWMAFGMLLGKIVSPVVLGVIFLLLITPVALIGRLLGRDVLRMKKATVPSYWVKRDPAGPEPASFQHQF